jgi:hypothetical protein
MCGISQKYNGYNNYCVKYTIILDKFIEKSWHLSLLASNKYNHPHL